MQRNSVSQVCLKTSIEDLNLSVRAYNCLKSANINTIAELVSRDEQDLLEVQKLW